MKMRSFTTLLLAVSATLAWALEINRIETTADYCQNGTITIEAINGALPYEYSLDGFATTQSSAVFTQMAHGTYTVYVRDANGETVQSDLNAVVVQNQVLELLHDPIPTNATCYSSNNGSAKMEVSGGLTYDSNMRYKIMLNRNNQVFTTDSIVFIDNTNSHTVELHKLPQGAYVGVIQDKGGCSIGFNFNIEAPAELGAQITNTSHVKCHGDNSGAIQLAITGGTAPYYANAYIRLSDRDSLVATTSAISNTTLTLSKLNAATYAIQVVDGNNCFLWLEETLSQPADTLGYLPYANSISCNGETSGKIFGTATGGTLPYTYQLEGVNVVYNSTNNTGLFENLSQGIYSAKVTDANGCLCTPAELLTVTTAEKLTVDPLTKIPAATVVCQDDKTASVTFTIVGREQVVAPSDTARYYSVRLFDITHQQEIITPTLKYTNKFHPVLTKNRVEQEPVLDDKGNPTFDKDGNALTLNVTYKDTLWTEGCHEPTKVEEVLNCSNIVYTEDLKGFDCDDKITVSGLGAGAYSINFYQGECQFGETITFTVEVTGSLPLVQINEVANFCDESEYTITPTITANPATNNYSWLLGGIEIGTTKDLKHTFVAAENGRTLQLIAANRCGSAASNAVNITVRNRPTAVLETSKDYLCQNQSANLSITFKGTAPFNYQLPDNEMETTINTVVNQEVTPAQDTLYTLVALSDAYCQANTEKDVDPTAVTVYPEADYGMTIDVPTPMVNGRYVTITGNDGFVSYQLFVNGEEISAAEQSNLFKTKKFAYGTSDNEFIMNFVDKNGCAWSTSEIKTITAELLPNIFTPNGDGINDTLLPDYAITIFDRNGNMLYQGETGWDGTFNGQPANEGIYLYVVEVTDYNGNTFVHKKTVTLER